MINRSRPRRTAFAAGFVVLSLVAASSCGSDDDGAPEVVDTTDATSELGEGSDDATGEDESLNLLTCSDYEAAYQIAEGAAVPLDYQFIDDFCDRNVDSEVAFRRCAPDGSLFPEVISGQTAEGEDNHVFNSHGIIRFHPVDDFVPGTQDDPLELLEMPDDELKFFVLDVDDTPDDSIDHADFVGLIVEEMSGVEPTIVKFQGLITEQDVIDELAGLDLTGKSFVNMSFGTYMCEDEGPEALVQFIDSLVDENPDLIFVASAGNDETSQIAWPAGHPSVTSVGALGEPTEDQERPRACFSNFGGVDNWVDGVEVATTEGTWSGTSFSAPQALVWIAAGATSTLTSAVQLPDQDTIRYPVSWETASGLAVSSETFCIQGSGYEPKLKNLQYS